jgi:acetyl-CoA carboxylase carboxyl transferase subunit beta
LKPSPKEEPESDAVNAARDSERELMAWFRRDKPKIEEQDADEERTVKTEGIFVKCSECENPLYKRELKESQQVCTNCGFHFRYSAIERLDTLFDDGKYERLDDEVTSGDPLGFIDTKPYIERIEAAKKSSGLPEAIISGTGKVGGHLAYAGAMDMSFIGGSMGSAVGEKITRLIERGLENRGAVIVFSASGGARMQEGTLSLMQMGKISAALSMLHEAKLPFISVLTDPTTGGVTASFAMLGDVIIAEPKALIGFAGPRVIEQTIRQKLPKGFQRSEFLLEHGMVDMVVDRREMQNTIIRVLDFMMPGRKSA